MSVQRYAVNQGSYVKSEDYDRLAAYAGGFEPLRAVAETFVRCMADKPVADEPGRVANYRLRDTGHFQELAHAIDSCPELCRSEPESPDLRLKSGTQTVYGVDLGKPGGDRSVKVWGHIENGRVVIDGTEELPPLGAQTEAPCRYCGQPKERHSYIKEKCLHLDGGPSDDCCYTP